MSPNKSHAASKSRNKPDAQAPRPRMGHIYPSEVRAVLRVLGDYLQRSPGATEISRLTTRAAPDPEVYLLFFGEVYLGTITRLPGTTATGADEFLHTPPAGP